MLLPYVMEAYGGCGYKKYKDIAIALGLGYNDTNEEKAANIPIGEIRRMNAAMSIPDKLLGIRNEEISKLARYAHKQANPLYPVPKQMDAKELERFYI